MSQVTRLPDFAAPRAWITCFAGAVAAALFVQQVIGQPLAGPHQIRAIVSRAVDAVAAEMRLGVDPAIVEQITASAGTFAGNFCYPTGSPAADARCRESLQNDSVLPEHVRGFLADTERSEAMVMSVGARLARVVGGNFSQIGWPSVNENIVGVVMVAPPDVASVSIATATGTVRIGGSATRVLLIRGRHQLVVRYAHGSEQTAFASVEARRRTVLAGTSPTPVGIVGRLDAPLDFFCYNRGAPQPTGPLALFNWGRSHIAGSATGEYLAPVTRWHGVDVRVNDDTGECGRTCREAWCLTQS